MGISWNRREFLKRTAAATAVSLAGWNRTSLSAGEAEANPPVDSWKSFRNGTQNLGLAHTEFPENPKLLWELTTPDGTASTAVIADGHVYMGTLSGDLHCLELKTGKAVWKYRSVKVVEPNSFAPGFNAAAALDEKHVYIGDDQGTFHAVDRATGKKAWQVATEGEFVGGAQVLNGQVIFGSHAGFLYCHEAATGKEIWKFETHGPVNATPCLAGKYTFTTGCDQPILRVVNIETGQQATEVPLDALLIASPAVRDDILYFGTSEGAVTALDWQKKKLVWEFSVPNREQQIQSSPAVTEELVVIGSRDKQLYCLDRKTGQLRWSFQTRAKIDSSPVIVENRVYFGASDRNVYGLYLADGKQFWKQPVKQSVTGSPAMAEGCMVIGTNSTKGRILCFG